MCSVEFQLALDEGIDSVSVQTEVQIMIKTSDLYREQSIQTGGPMVQEQGVTNTSLFVYHYQGVSVMSIYVLLMGLFFQPAIVKRISEYCVT